jgi:salicylate hydroxylase
MTGPQPAPNDNARAALARPRSGGAEPVLIAGAGIGGLAAAIALARRGIASHVLERRSAFSEEGAGIQIGPNGTRILRELNVADELQPRVGTPHLISVREGESGIELARLPLGRWIEARHGAPYWVAQRSDLHAALLHAARNEPLIALSMGFAVTEVATEPGRVAVADGTDQAWTGSVLIGADGLWSSVRQLVFQSDKPRFVGKSAARSVIPLDMLPPEFKRETGIWLFPDAHVVHYPVSAKTELAIVAILPDRQDDEQDWSAPVPPDWVHEHLPAAAPPLRDLVMRARTWRKWSLHTMPLMQSLTRGPVALLGDAAHPILPYLAQGGALALEDALVLAIELHGRTDDMPAALKRYELRRRWRVARLAAASRRNGRIYQLTGTLAAARNFALRQLPPRQLMARYDWIYGWRGE